MNCPSCSAPLPAVERCPSCKLTLRRLDLKFGAIPRHATYFTDRTERVPLKDVQRARDELRLFERRFPQCPLSVFVIDLPKGESPNEYAFWLANRGRFSSVETLGYANFDLLLVVDTGNGNATLAAGYGLEEFVSEDDLADALRFAEAGFRAGDVYAGVHECIERLSGILKGASDRQSRERAPVETEV